MNLMSFIMTQFAPLLPPVENNTSFLRPFLAVLLPGFPPGAMNKRGKKEHNNGNSSCCTMYHIHTFVCSPNRLCGSLESLIECILKGWYCYLLWFPCTHTNTRSLNWCVCTNTHSNHCMQHYGQHTFRGYFHRPLPLQSLLCTITVIL